MKTILRKDKKALSPVIAVVLMVAVAVAAAVLAYIWSVGLQSGTQAKVRDTVEQKINKNKQIQIESKIKNSDLGKDDTPAVSIRNIGGSTIKDGDYTLYVDGQFCANSTAPGTIADGGRVELSFNIGGVDDCIINPDNNTTSFNFKITGPEGVTAENYTIAYDSTL